MAYIDEENLLAVFQDDDALRDRNLYRRHGGQLNITSGGIVACDPMVQPDRPAFTRSVAQRGAHAVEVLHDRHGSHALAVMWLRGREQVQPEQLRWEMAVLQSQAVQGLGEDEFFGYPVDAGLGCFMDMEAATAMSQREARHADDADFNYYDSVLDEELVDDIADHYPLGPGSRNNLVVFRSGWGDGSYPSFWGLDAEGQAVVLVTDFMTIKGGDARSDREKRKAAYLASLSPEKLAALEALGSAIASADVPAVRAALASGQVGVNEIIPSTGETAIFSAIRLNQPDVLRVLLDGGECPALPEAMYYSDVRTYLAYALRLKVPRDPQVLALLGHMPGDAVDAGAAHAAAAGGEPPVPAASPAGVTAASTAAQSRKSLWQRLFG